MSRRTRQSSPRRSHRSWPDVRPTVQSYEPAWGPRFAPRDPLDAASWPIPSRSRRLPPSRPWSPCACATRRPIDVVPVSNSGRSDVMQACECTHPPCPSLHPRPRQPGYFVPSSTPFLARFGLEALATVRVEEDTGAVPRSLAGSLAFGRNGLSSSNGRLVRTARLHILADLQDTRAQGKP